MTKQPDAVQNFVIFGNPRLIEWITQLETPLKPDWKMLKALKTMNHANVTLHYRVKPYFEANPYFGGETNGEVIELIYSAGKIQLDFSAMAWTSPELCLKHWSCAPEFSQWQNSISSFLERK